MSRGAAKVGTAIAARTENPSHFLATQLMNDADALAQDSANHLGDIRQNQQQRRGKENESGLANFRMFEHG